MDFVRALQAAGLRRAWCMATAPGTVEASHQTVRPLADAIAASPDFRDHEACLFEVGRDSGHLLSAFLHSTTRGQGAGGLRLWSYDTIGGVVADGLRLSLGMGQKSALAGLWWGGGKGVIARVPELDYDDPGLRRRVYRDYGRFVSGLCGCYVTAEDVGTRPEDLASVHETTRHATCVPPAIGGSGNPSRLTAHGVVVAMEAALAHTGRGDLGGKRIALQGLGNVAGFIVEALLERGVAQIVGADIDPRRIEAVRAAHPGAPLIVERVDPGDHRVLTQACDIVAPCAVGAVLGPETIEGLRAPIVCGAANNQLTRPSRDGAALRARGIVYVPDFLANRMGIVNCANEQYGVISPDPAIDAHLRRDTPFGVYRRTLEVLRRAESSGRSTHEEAERLATDLMAEDHPLWPGRGRQILASLRTGGWADEPAS